MVAAFFQWNGRLWITVSGPKTLSGGFFKKDVLEQTECFRKHLWTYYSLLSWTNSSKARGLRFTDGTGGHILQCKLANFHSRNPKIRLRQGNDHPMIQLAMEFTGKASKFLATSWPPSSSHLKKNTSFWSVISNHFYINWYVTPCAAGGANPIDPLSPHSSFGYKSWV